MRAKGVIGLSAALGASLVASGVILAVPNSGANEELSIETSAASFAASIPAAAAPVEDTAPVPQVSVDTRLRNAVAGLRLGELRHAGPSAVPEFDTPFGTVSVIMQDLDPVGVEQEVAMNGATATTVESPADGWPEGVVAIAVYDRSPSYIGYRIVFSDRVLGVSLNLADKANVNAIRQLRGLTKSLAARV